MKKYTIVTDLDYDRFFEHQDSNKKNKQRKLFIDVEPSKIAFQILPNNLVLIAKRLGHVSDQFSTLYLSSNVSNDIKNHIIFKKIRFRSSYDAVFQALQFDLDVFAAGIIDMPTALKFNDYKTLRFNQLNF